MTHRCSHVLCQGQRQESKCFFEENMINALQNQKINGERVRRGKFIEQIYDVEFVFFAYQLLTDSGQFESSMNLLMDRAVERFKLDRVFVFEAQYIKAKE